jgi:hypothetical protein
MNLGFKQIEIPVLNFNPFEIWSPRGMDRMIYYKILVFLTNNI